MTWYHNVNGVADAVFKDPRRKRSRFWGEGKWRAFVEPLLPAEKRTFVEVGCNAGLLLKMAVDSGFTRVIGIEGCPQRFAQAMKFRESNGYPYKLIHQEVGANFILEDLPLADVTLISNVHYYFSVNVFSDLVDRLRSRTLYCILVSARAPRRKGNARHYLDSVRGYFRGWEEMGIVGDWEGKEGLDDKDPAPREQMYGVLFKGCLESMDTSELWERTSRVTLASGKDGLVIARGWREFFAKVIADVSYDPQETSLYQYWAQLGKSDWILSRLQEKKALAHDIMEKGIKVPIYFDQKGRVLDGMHRLNLAYELGYRHILARVL